MNPDHQSVAGGRWGSNLKMTTYSVGGHDPSEVHARSVETPEHHDLETGALNDGIKLGAQTGYPLAQNDLGVLYENGIGDVKKDFVQAAQWYKMSANHGLAVAQHNMAVLYEQGKGVSQDLSASFKMYSEAAKQGYAASQYNLAVSYALGRGVPADLEAALHWYCEAGRRDFEDAAEKVLTVQCEIHNARKQKLHDSTSEVEKNAGTCGSSSNEIGIALGLDPEPIDPHLIEAASIHMSQGDFDSAARLLRRAADQGMAQAQYNLGIFFYNGRGVQKDLGHAVYWFRKAAAQDYPNAVYMLAFMSENGLGYSKDLPSAFALYRQAASLQESDSQGKLALLMLDRDFQAMTGVRYREEGWDFVPPNHAEAKRLLKLSRNSENGVSERLLAMLGWDWPPLQMLARQYVDRMLATFASRRGSFLDYAEQRWSGVFEKSLWGRIESESERLHETATTSGKVESGWVVEPGREGRVVLVTVAARSDVKSLLRSFPNGDYCRMYRVERRHFRETADWDSRDFVHWMFLWDDENVQLHLLYQFSLKKLLNLIDLQIQHMRQSRQQEPKGILAKLRQTLTGRKPEEEALYNVQLPPRIMPESLVSVQAFQVVASELEAEERVLIEKGHRTELVDGGKKS